MSIASDLFAANEPVPVCARIGPQARVLRGMALPYVAELMRAVDDIQQISPFRHMVTPGGFPMSAAMTNCGELGWVTDRRGYRYAPLDPVTGQAWPVLPDVLRHLARAAAAEVGFDACVPDACLINRYQPGARLTLHQDRNERDFTAPIVSISLGLSAIFLFGGHARSDKTQRIALNHGDIAVWGGVDRLRYHGVMPLKDGHHPLLGTQRINFTLRKAG